MRYPNIRAEYLALVKLGAMNLACFADALNVTHALAKAIISGDEEPTLSEVTKAQTTFDLLGEGERYGQCSLGYLLTGKPAMMPTASHRRERFIFLLSAILTVANEECPSHLYTVQRNGVAAVLDSLTSGKPVTYALYRHARMALSYVIDNCMHDWRPRRGIRTEGLSA